MKGSKVESRSVTLEVIHGGSQLRAYGDHVYEGYLTFSTPENQMYASKYGQDASTAKQYLRCFVTNFFDKDESHAWHEPVLERLDQVSPLRWHYLITYPYLD